MQHNIRDCSIHFYLLMIPQECLLMFAHPVDKQAFETRGMPHCRSKKWGMSTLKISSNGYLSPRTHFLINHSFQKSRKPQNLKILVLTNLTPISHHCCSTEKQLGAADGNAGNLCILGGSFGMEMLGQRRSSCTSDFRNLSQAAPTRQTNTCPKTKGTVVLENNVYVSSMLRSHYTSRRMS